jgi:DNA-binding response OmpR family regulator
MAQEKGKVLVIDDEPDQIKLLEYNLSREGYRVVSARDGEGGLATARREHPAVVILDVMMPGLDGWEVVKRLRADPLTAAVPVLMLTAKAEETDRVLGLELGADDYVVKPFSVREVMARVKALIRRSLPPDDPSKILKAGPLVLDNEKRYAAAGEQELKLTTTEFEILRALMASAGRVLGRDRLLNYARGEDAEAFDRTIDVHMASLRRKLGGHSDLLETVRGVGYRLKTGP